MIAIIGDLHDNLVNFEIFLKKTVPYSLTALWSVGDLGTPESYQSICEQFSGRIWATPGNVEIGHDVFTYQKLTMIHPHLVWQDRPPVLVTDPTNHLTAALFHFPAEAREYHQTPPADILASGHTHQPFFQRWHSGWHVNPGTLGGVFLPATYVIFNPADHHFQLERLF